jgi:hypothetical protein
MLPKVANALAFGLLVQIRARWLAAPVSRVLSDIAVAVEPMAC